MIIAELVIAIVSIAASFIPTIVDSISEKYYDKRGISTGKMYALLDKIIGSANVLSNAKASKMITKLQNTINAYMPSGGQAFVEYLSKAKNQARDKMEKLSTASVEQELYSNAAQTLANAYESLPSKQKASASGRALKDQIKDNTTKAVAAAQKIDPNLDVSNELAKFDEIGQKVEVKSNPVDDAVRFKFTAPWNLSKNK